MSESYVPVPTSGVEPPANDDLGTADTAKQEAADLKNTAAEQARNVAGTAKDEARSVAHEAKSQAKDLYAQTQSELREQAGVQQQRVASGLRSMGDELSSMASNSEQQGLASDLVRQVSDRASSAASWLDARDPGSLLNEVKAFARRKPGTFIAAAAIAGVVAGRLTRALAGSAADEKEADAAAPRTPAPPVAAPYPPVVEPGYPAPGVVDETPVFTERASSFRDELPGEGNQP